MELVVAGGKRLSGSVIASGSKNATLAVMAGALLAEGETFIENVPDIGDVGVMAHTLQEIGVSVKRAGPRALRVRSRRVVHSEPPYELCKMLRASSLLLGPLLARNGCARVALPGGDQIGSRPMDLHVKGLRALGADVEVEHGYVTARARSLVGARVYLDFPSVGATENIMMAACFAHGTSIIENAAREPEVVDLANFLALMGASIRGAGTDVIRIEGGGPLSPVTYSVIPDRIEAATLLAAGIITYGNVRVTDVIPTHLESTLSKFGELGAEIEVGADYVEVSMRSPVRACDTKTLPYPGFPTDMQPQLSAVLACAAGVSVITESVFENRFLHVDELKRMGAVMRLEGRSLIVEGVPRLTGARVRAPDLRAGAALVLAGLTAEGETVISGVEHIARGHEDLCSKLAALGASIGSRGASMETAAGEDRSP
ncbi:MAG: UDP-N-acetylglucosamine 1-carboxyvinyltransferase 1 [Firmicutes bacterium ADurb.BinA052]|nr:MAG: UDP-N-acetylglucosamine 1-carboxyvinyltransferase 1 [Firmicutes bacterium ADurb.BinA052]